MSKLETSCFDGIIHNFGGITPIETFGQAYSGGGVPNLSAVWLEKEISLRISIPEGVTPQSELEEWLGSLARATTAIASTPGRRRRMVNFARIEGDDRYSSYSPDRYRAALALAGTVKFNEFPGQHPTANFSIKRLLMNAPHPYELGPDKPFNVAHVTVSNADK